MIKPWLQRNVIPVFYTTVMKVAVAGITICLIIIGAMSVRMLPLGMSQTVLLEKNSVIYDYHKTAGQYTDAGPTGYLVMNNLNYTNKENFVQI